MTKRWLWIAVLLGVGVVSRWIPHPPNFSPLMAIALFAGFVLPGPLALILPVAAMFVGDMLLGFHDSMWVVYLSFLPMVWLGTLMPEPSRHPRSWLTWGFYGLLASTLFFVTTNLAVWWGGTLYPRTQDGLISCFVLAIPFFHNSVLSTWIYLAGLASVRELVPSIARETKQPI